MVALTTALRPQPPASRPRPSLKEVSSVVTLPPPIGGWNARDPLPNMPADDAIVMDNLIPGTGAASIRFGFSQWATGLGSYVETLMEYAPPSGTNKLFAATSTAVYDASSAGAIGAPVITPATNGRWQHTMFATSGGNYLVCANGADAVRNFDGTTWTLPSISGPTSSNLIGVTAHVQRLWFVEKNKLDPWYLPVASIAGTATKLIISPFCKLGGYLVAIGSWSRDGGSGPDDLAVFVTSKGEVVIYSGTNPDFDNGWQQVGTFRIPEPIGRRCLIKTGSDLGVLTSAGLVPLSQILGSAGSVQETQAITDKIRNAFKQAYIAGKANFGWQPVEYPVGRLLVVNYPETERSTQRQFVMNTDTGSWARFTGINAGCWSLFGDALYFGGNNGIVYQYGTDYLDDASVISVVLQQSFTDLKETRLKQFKAARPLFIGPQDYAPSIEVKLDYDTSPVTLPSPAAPTAGSVWDVATWDVSSWSGTSSPTSRWQTLNGIGHSVSIAMAFSLSQEFTLNSTDIMFEVGGYF